VFESVLAFMFDDLFPLIYRILETSCLLEWCFQIVIQFNLFGCEKTRIP